MTWLEPQWCMFTRKIIPPAISKVCSAVAKSKWFPQQYIHVAVKDKNVQYSTIHTPTSQSKLECNKKKKKMKECTDFLGSQHNTFKRTPNTCQPLSSTTALMSIFLEFPLPVI